MINLPDFARLPQRCRCGGDGVLAAMYDMDRHGVVSDATWMAICDICGAATVRHHRWRTAVRDWLARRCPHTYHEVAK